LANTPRDVGHRPAPQPECDGRRIPAASDSLAAPPHGSRRRGSACWTDQEVTMKVASAKAVLSYRVLIASRDH
jgi:hypothetical protein